MYGVYFFHVCDSYRYASLYFCCAIEEQDNELITLEIIHRFVELLDKYFGSVSQRCLNLYMLFKICFLTCLCVNLVSEPGAWKQSFYTEYDRFLQGLSSIVSPGC